MDGDPDSNYAHFCLQKFGWEPSKYLSMTPYERAFVVASIDVRLETERKIEADMKRKAKRKK